MPQHHNRPHSRQRLRVRRRQHLDRMELGLLQEPVDLFRTANKYCGISSNGCYCSDMLPNVSTKTEGALSHLIVLV